jgi:hypothetical protein
LSQKGESALTIAIQKKSKLMVLELLLDNKADAAAVENVPHFCTTLALVRKLLLHSTMLCPLVELYRFVDHLFTARSIFP